MTRWPGRGFKHMNQNILHAYTECPEGSIVAIAKRDAVNLMDLEAMKGLEWGVAVGLQVGGDREA